MDGMRKKKIERRELYAHLARLFGHATPEETHQEGDRIIADIAEDLNCSADEAQEIFLDAARARAKELLRTN